MSERSLADSRGPGALEQVSERSLADSRVRISDTVEEKEIKAEGKGWQTPKSGKTISKKDQPKFMQSYTQVRAQVRAMIQTATRMITHPMGRPWMTGIGRILFGGSRLGRKTDARSERGRCIR